MNDWVPSALQLWLFFTDFYQLLYQPVFFLPPDEWASTECTSPIFINYFLLATTGAAVTDLKDQLSCWVEVEICKQCRWMTHWMNTELWKSADERVQNFLSQFYQVLFQVLFFSQFYQLLLTVLSSTFCSQQLLLRVYIWCQSCDRQSCKKLPSCLFFIFTN